MSLSPVDLEVLVQSGTADEQRQAAAIIPIVEKQHELLVTLLLCNAVAMEVSFKSHVLRWLAPGYDVTPFLTSGKTARAASHAASLQRSRDGGTGLSLCPIHTPCPTPHHTTPHPLCNAHHTTPPLIAPTPHPPGAGVSAVLCHVPPTHTRTPPSPPMLHTPPHTLPPHPATPLQVLDYLLGHDDPRNPPRLNLHVLPPPPTLPNPPHQVLDYLLGHDDPLFRRQQLKALVSIHGAEVRCGAVLARAEVWGAVLAGAEARVLSMPPAQHIPTMSRLLFLFLMAPPHPSSPSHPSSSSIQPLQSLEFYPSDPASLPHSASPPSHLTPHCKFPTAFSDSPAPISHPIQTPTLNLHPFL
ncbi:unnamed protein product [Closterium sp. NIES-53]